MITIDPSKKRAAAHRAMALAALHANSSLATRLARYNDHMAKARALEATGGAQ
jgi:5-enolpyruvylshikimate-3-phosphate synthase